LKLLNPEKAESFILKGQIYSALGENNRSLSELEEAIKLEPRNDFAYVRLALIRYNLKEFEKSLEDLDTALKINSNSKWALLWKGIIVGEWKKDWVTANSYYQKALSIDPRFDMAYYNLGWSFLKSSPKDYKSAQQSFEKALKINPNYKEALYGLAMVYGYQDRYEIAKLYLTKSKDLDNKFLTAWKWLGIVNNEMGDFKEALFAFDKAINLNPSDSKLYVRRAKLFSKQKNYMQGIKDLRLAAEMDPSNKRIWFYLGDIMIKLENPRGALDYFEKATVIQPKYSEAFLGKAIAFTKLKDDKNAEINFKQSLKFSRNKKERVLFEKGKFEKSRGDFMQAIKDFQEARKINIKFSDAWLAEANILVDLKRRGEAISLLNEYLKLRPEDNIARKILLNINRSDL
jgi:tetratricopeptide (TPR) repeat protein